MINHPTAVVILPRNMLRPSRLECTKQKPFSAPSSRT